MNKSIWNLLVVFVYAAAILLTVKATWVLADYILASKKKIDYSSALVCNNGIQDTAVIYSDSEITYHDGAFWIKDNLGLQRAFVKNQFDICMTLPAEYAKQYQQRQAAARTKQKIEEEKKKLNVQDT